MKTLQFFSLCACAALLSAAPAGAESFTNSIGMEFVKIPAGSYMRGCDPTFEKCGNADGSGGECEMPQRRISISTFWLGKYEVTQEQWVEVMGSNPSASDQRGRDKPVNQVSWNDAQEFIRRLNKKEGHNRYRLPTEAEWEYAARAGSNTRFSFGDEDEQLGGYGWYEGNSRGKWGFEVHPVGQLRPNAWGLYDMHGNVWEWCSDWHDCTYYKWSKKTANPEGPDRGEKILGDYERVVRGGSFWQSAAACRSAKRFGNGVDNRYYSNGFRVALSPGR